MDAGESSLGVRIDVCLHLEFDGRNRVVGDMDNKERLLSQIQVLTNKHLRV